VQRRSLRDQTSQAIILVALTLPFLFGIVALVVDSSTLMAQRRAVQNAADAAALAAAQELPLSGTCDGPPSNAASCQGRVLTAANHYSHDVNGGPAVDHACVGSSDTNCFTNPYKSSSQLVEVRLHKDVSTFFTAAAHITGSFGVSARAVASRNPETGTTTNVSSTSSTVNNPDVISNSTSYGTTVTPGTPPTPGSAPAVYAGNPNCGGHGFQMTGGPVTFNGGVIANGHATAASADPFSLQTDGTKMPLSYGGPNNCAADGSGINDTDAAKTSNSPAGVPWPTPWDPATFTEANVPCDFRAPSSAGTGQWQPSVGFTVALAASPNGATEVGNTVTLTTSTANGFVGVQTGDSITVAGVANTNYNGNFTVSAVVSTTQIRYVSTKTSLPASGGGTVNDTSALPPGTYCARRTDGTSAGTIRLTAGGVITVVAPNIIAATQGASYVAAQQHLLFFATGGKNAVTGLPEPTNEQDVITVSNKDNVFDGVMFAPFGYFRLSNGGTSDSGHTSIIAWGVNLTGGNGLTFTGAYSSSGGSPGTPPVTATTSTTVTPVVLVTGTTYTVTYPFTTVTNTVTTGTTIGLGE